MFFQQFIGCNGTSPSFYNILVTTNWLAAIIYYAPTIFSQLGLDGNTVCLLQPLVSGDF